jgi:hypothetical protein
MGRRTRLFSILGAAVLGALMACVLHAQQTPPSEPLLPFGDSHNWIVLTPLVYTIGDTSDHIDVPAGFVTDLASIPRIFWGPPLFLTPAGQYSRASIVHDYLYWSQKCTRDQADRLLVIAMKESKVGSFDAAAIYEGVHQGGLQAWLDNARDKARGVPRILPAANRQPQDSNMNWPEYANALMQAGVQSLNPPDDGAYCRRGDVTDVPLKPKP